MSRDAFRAPPWMSDQNGTARSMLAFDSDAYVAGPWRSGMNAIKLLKDHHKEIKGLLEELGEAGPRAARRRVTLVEQVAGELTAHEQMEEEVLYPALAKHRDARESVLEGYEEHHVANLILAELRDTPVNDERWAAKAKVLTENVEHHIEEEEREIFKHARSVFDSEQLDEMAERMASVKEGQLSEA